MYIRLIRFVLVIDIIAGTKIKMKNSTQLNKRKTEQKWKIIQKHNNVCGIRQNKSGTYYIIIRYKFVIKFCSLTI